MHAKAEFHRERARHCRILAERIRDEAAKSHMLDVARQYDQLAEEAERLAS